MRIYNFVSYISHHYRRAYAYSLACEKTLASNRARLNARNSWHAKAVCASFTHSLSSCVLLCGSCSFEQQRVFILWALRKLRHLKRTSKLQWMRINLAILRNTYKANCLLERFSCTRAISLTLSFSLSQLRDGLANLQSSIWSDCASF